VSLTKPVHLLPDDPTLGRYVIDPMVYDWGPILAPWSPPLPLMGDIICVSLFCDVFVGASDGSVQWLNAQAGRVDRIANNRDHFIERVYSEYVAFLKTPLIDAIPAMGLEVPPGHVLGLKQPEMEGGKYRLDNLGVAPLEAAFAYLGALYRKSFDNEPPVKPWMH
jgi:hypothetical protein